MPSTSFTRALRAGSLAIAALAAAAQSAWAQGEANYPTKPIRLIVGFAAGGGNDLFARLVGQKLSEIIGQPVIVENKPGAGGRIAVDFVKNQPADGYTVMVAASGQMAIAAAIFPKLPYHPTRDFVPLAMIASFPLILAGPANETIKTVKDLVAYGKANPDKSNYATSSPAFTITTELFKLKTGMPAVGVPYKSSNEDDAQRRRRQYVVRDRRRSPDHAADQWRQDPRIGGDRIGTLLGAPECAEHDGGRLSGGQYRVVERVFRLGQRAAGDRQEARRCGAARDGGHRRA
jgi:hypothetical protein